MWKFGLLRPALHRGWAGGCSPRPERSVGPTSRTNLMFRWCFAEKITLQEVLRKGRFNSTLLCFSLYFADFPSHMFIKVVPEPIPRFTPCLCRSVNRCLVCFSSQLRPRITNTAFLENRLLEASIADFGASLAPAWLHKIDHNLSKTRSASELRCA